MANIKIALIYDFDKTLSTDDMQAFDFMQTIGENPKQFWDKCNQLGKKHSADKILVYMYCMLKAYKEKGLKLTKTALIDCGKNIELYKGVESWFDRINAYGKNIGVDVEHYIVSSGLKEMLEGNEIRKYFKEIYAGYFIYDESGEAIWPALAINYTDKTQYIYRINKGILNVGDESVNDKMPYEERPVPFTNMIYIGDSATDIPSMRLVMKSGGYAIGIYNPNLKESKQYLKKLITQNRINYIVEADYSENSNIDKIVKEIMISILHSSNLKAITEEQKRSE